MNLKTIPGNMYYVAGVSNYFSEDKSSVRALAFWCIAIIQGVLPPLILLSKFYSFGVRADKALDWRCCPWIPIYDKDGDYTCFLPSNGPGSEGSPPDEVTMFDDWKAIPTTKLISTFFIFIFVLNCVYVLREEKRNWKRLIEVFGKVRYSSPEYTISGEMMFILGTLLNTSVVIFCCISSYFVIGAALTPQQLVFDSLALFFLFTLDDVGSLGFITEDDWPGNHLAWVYLECIERDRDEAKGDVDWKLHFADAGCMRCLYTFTRWIVSFVVRSSNLLLALLPVGAIFTPFSQVTPE